MSQNWIRHFELQIVDENGTGISLSDFKVTFRIEWADTRFPRVANVKIYNVSQETQARIMGEEFSKIRIIAGYDGAMPVVPASEVGVAHPVAPGDEGKFSGTNYGLIFTGDIRFTINGKDNITDSWVLVQAASDYNAFLFASTKTTLAAGYTTKDLLDLTMRGFNPYGITPGIIGDMPTTVFPRGLPLYHSNRDIMDDIAKMCGGTWQMVDGQVHVVPSDKYVQEAIVLNADTGLIGMPQQTMGGGVNVRCLINPNIKINGLVQIDQASIYRIAAGNSDIAQTPSRIGTSTVNGNIETDMLPSRTQAASIAADGVYIVKAIDYTGETRGQSWYMDMMCFARGARDLQTNASLNRTF
ncbi:hypothetical protein [Trabulsiella odontotermitis]|uniref:hypothetical protein n=1 Tax=Trabulsiella odontotermitis TaxID=379893 RepID=UPI0006BA5F39|nr:hypothetical protein [Trabulsiella odontotermitis]